MIGDILQPSHLLFVLVVALLVLGPKKLPEVARSLGKGLRDFKSAIGGDDEADEPVGYVTPESATAPAQPVAPPPMERPVAAVPPQPMATTATDEQREPAEYVG
jgi:sec-independent protein translocase protein TatA